jgi:hypothetical protein
MATAAWAVLLPVSAKLAGSGLRAQLGSQAKISS